MSMSLFRMCVVACGCLLFFLVFGCGGGGGGGLGGVGGGGGSIQALLGPIIGADVTVYRVSDTTTPIEGPVSTSVDVTSLETAGEFNLKLNGVGANEMLLVTIEGGQDVDADDDGVLDAAYTSNNGVIKLVATAAELKAGNITANVLTDMVARLALSDATVTSVELNALTQDLLADVNDDGVVDFQDALAFDPKIHQAKCAIPWSDIQRNAIKLIHDGCSDEAIRAAYNSMQKSYIAVSGVEKKTAGSSVLTANTVSAANGAMKGGSGLRAE